MMTTATRQHSIFRFEERAAFGIGSVNPFQEALAFRFEENDPKLYFGDDGEVVRSARDFAWIGRESRDGEESLVYLLQDETFTLRLTWICRVAEHKASWRFELVNEGGHEVSLRHIDLFDAVADAPVRQFHQRIRLDLGEADWMEEKDVNHATGYPVNIGDRLFLGVDWPVADVLTDGRRITCRQYCADTLAPGQTFRSRSVTVGACEEGCMAERFLAHLKELRGRETRRASFYFSWLTHSWEGLTDEELKLNLDFFERTRGTFGIQFDIYAVDAGVIETNHYGYERYRHMHEKLLPNGLKPHADRVKDLGMEFGIWIGPNEFGEKGSRLEQRIAEVTAMVRDWNVSLIKLDTAVAQLLGDDPYANEHAMRGLERLIAECRAINPALIVINHRASYSPYILTILDSTLWEGRETYPDVHMVNHDKPRLFTRYAQHGFGEPTYFGVYSELLEDCGICINGDVAGWADETVIHAFGRSLMLSPEAYGTLFLLNEAELTAFGRLLRLAEEFRASRTATTFDPAMNMYVHQLGGSRALLCIMNDSWDKTSKEIAVDEVLGQAAGASRVKAVLRYPWRSEADGTDGAEPSAVVNRGGKLRVELHPFGVALVELVPMEGESAENAFNGEAVLSALPTDRMAGSSVYLGRFERERLDAASEGAAERTKFALRSDPAEEQLLQRLAPSAYPEVNAVRDAFRDKIKKLHGIAANAWDGDDRTAWGDPWHWKHRDNIWRIDLGEPIDAASIEITLSQRSPGAVFEEDEGRRLADPVLIEASPDCIDWVPCHAVVFRERQGFHRSFTSLIAGEFSVAAAAHGGAKVRYVRIHANGLLVQDISIKERKNGRLVEADRSLWRGNNLLTDRQPIQLYSHSFVIEEAAEGSYLAVVCRLPEEVKVPLLQEIAVAWLTVDGGEELPLIDASPTFPLHGWEWNTLHEGNAWVLRMPVRPEWRGKAAELKLAWYGPDFGSRLPAPGTEPQVTGYIVTTANGEWMEG